MTLLTLAAVTFLVSLVAAALGAAVGMAGGVSEKNGRRPYVVHRVLPGMGLMLGAGTLSTLLGIGSGVLKIPAMDATLGLPVKISSGTAT
ncbi:hypothetical protein ACQBAR_13265 [Propionibacteriaceae bacterium Y1685]|uniref:hypothetical protein n=1 Tax=Microlunatus sp. Y1700 TaxID=3418487 RepID=UPI003B7AFAE5